MFQGVKVALDRCIVIGAACSAHALLDEQLPDWELDAR